MLVKIPLSCGYRGLSKVKPKTVKYWLSLKCRTIKCRWPSRSFGVTTVCTSWRHCDVVDPVLIDHNHYIQQGPKVLRALVKISKVKLDWRWKHNISIRNINIYLGCVDEWLRKDSNYTVIPLSISYKPNVLGFCYNETSVLSCHNLSPSSWWKNVSSELWEWAVNVEFMMISSLAFINEWKEDPFFGNRKRSEVARKYEPNHVCCVDYTTMTWYMETFSYMIYVWD